MNIHTFAVLWPHLNSQLDARSEEKGAHCDLGLCELTCTISNLDYVYAV